MSYVGTICTNEIQNCDRLRWFNHAGGGRIVTGRMFAGPIILLRLDLLHGARSYMCVHLCQTKGTEHSGVTSEIRGGQRRAEEAHMQCPSHLARLWLRTWQPELVYKVCQPKFAVISVSLTTFPTRSSQLHSMVFLLTSSRPIHLAMFASRCSAMLCKLSPSAGFLTVPLSWLFAGSR